MFYQNLVHFFNNHFDATLLNRSAVDTSAKVTSVVFNSSDVSEGSLFVALTGGARDGHEFINNAIEKGAKSVLVSNHNYIPKDNKDVLFIFVDNTLFALQKLSKYYRSDVLNAKVIAVTGSNGKTTTKDILFTVLSSKFKTHKTIGNLNNHIGMPLSILNAPIDTEFLILELGMNHFGEIELLSSISKPDYAIITNIGESHIEHLGSRIGIAKAKSEISYSFSKDDVLFLPRDSDVFEDLISLNSFLQSEQIISFGSEESLNHPSAKHYNKVSYKKHNHDLFLKESFYVDFLGGDVSLPLVGDHNISNSLPCMYIAHLAGMSLDEINHALEKLKITDMRFELVNTHKNFTLINDSYNASPTSMKANISAFLFSFKDKKRVLVLGDIFELGADSAELHKQVGHFLNSFNNDISLLVTIGEHSAKISSSFKGSHRHFSNKKEATQYLRVFDDKNIALFFKASRGMAFEEIINELK